MDEARNRRPDARTEPTQAVILAGGRGLRQRPYSDVLPKPLLPVDGRPTLDSILSAVAAAGVTHVCLVVHYLGHKIREYVGDGSAWGLAASFREQGGMQGTAQALGAAADLLTGPSFVLAADYVLPVGYLLQLKRAHIRQGTDIAVSLKKLPPQELGRRSSVRFGRTGSIEEIVEKPAQGTAPSQIGASLIYIVPPDIREYLADVPLSPRGEYELPEVINRMLRDGYTSAGWLQPAPAEWQPPI